MTGASYGVGAATALALARDGYDVALSATRTENLAGILRELAPLGVRTLPLALDLRSGPAIEQAMAQIVAAFGGVDVLVNNAGANLRKLAVEVTAPEWREVMEVNVTGTFLLTQQVGRHLIGAAAAGAIVNIASTHGLIGAPERSTYGISKGAIIQMTRMLAIEWAPHGIRVNAVAPGRLDTASPSRAGADPKYMAAMLERIPLHRLATAEEVADDGRLSGAAPIGHRPGAGARRRPDGGVKRGRRGGSPHGALAQCGSGGPGLRKRFIRATAGSSVRRGRAASTLLAGPCATSTGAQRACGLRPRRSLTTPIGTPTRSIVSTTLPRSTWSQFMWVGAMKKSAWSQSGVHCSRRSASFSNDTRSPQTPTV